MTAKYPSTDIYTTAYSYEKTITQIDENTNTTTVNTVAISEDTFNSLTPSINTFTLPTGPVTVTVDKSIITIFQYESTQNESKRTEFAKTDKSTVTPQQTAKTGRTPGGKQLQQEQNPITQASTQKRIVNELGPMCEKQGNFPDEKCNKVKLIKEHNPIIDISHIDTKKLKIAIVHAMWHSHYITQIRDQLKEYLTNYLSSIEKVSYQEPIINTPSKIYTFTPKGDIVELVKGANLLDFAYYIHADIGNKAIGGLINGKNAKLTDELSNGDNVEIIVSGSKKYPSEDLVKMVKTAKSRSLIRKALRKKEKSVK